LPQKLNLYKNFIKLLDNKIFFNFFQLTYQRYLIYKSKKFLTNYSNFEIYPKKYHNDPFSVLCEKYGTDKGGSNSKLNERDVHFYSCFYNNFFKDKKDQIKLILECGIGTTDETISANMSKLGNPGASLRVLREYFLNAKIYGADIDKNILFTSDRISTYYVDQLDSFSINSMWENINEDNFDLIIDDGMHSLHAAYNFFSLSFKKLKKNGIYIIEDVHISYMVQLAKKLKEFNPKIISSSKKNNIDDYLFLIRKY